jgi:hypothetical protein
VSRRTARRRSAPHDVSGLWHQARDIRDEWLQRGLSTQPADRPSVEHLIRRLYASVDAPPPTFRWVSSPHAADVGPPVTFDSSLFARDVERAVELRLAQSMMDLRGRLDDRVGRRPSDSPWQRPQWIRDGLDPPAALAGRASVVDVVDEAVFGSLRRTLRDELCGPIRSASTSGAGMMWYGQHEAHWVARYDVYRRIGRTSYAEPLLDVWTALSTHGGWWFPRDGTCVVVDRPAQLHTEPIPGARFGELRLHNESGPAVSYRDGWGVHMWHGTRVPAVNGSVERDGHRRRYGLTVPADIDDPIAAAAWSYGLAGADYARLLRRT